MENKPAYYCSKCKMAVIVVHGEKPIRACNCQEATIIVSMEARTLKSTGGIRI